MLLSADSGVNDASQTQTLKWSENISSFVGARLLLISGVSLKGSVKALTKPLRSVLITLSFLLGRWPTRSSG